MSLFPKTVEYPFKFSVWRMDELFANICRTVMFTFKLHI